MLPYGSQTNDPVLIGTVCKTTVIARYADHCDLRLENGERIRLYQHDSCAAEDPRLMNDLPDYIERKTHYLLVTHRRSDSNEILYYGNERWAKHNPWSNLTLQLGDQLTGVVLRSVQGANDMLRGYLIQLDTTVPVGDKPNRELHPDILVYLPVNELPWENGSTGAKPMSGAYRRIVLEKGDQVQVVLQTIHHLPLLPEVSLLDAMQHQTNNFWADAQREARGVRLKMGLHGSFLSETDEHEYIDVHFDLSLCRILLVDDKQDSLERLEQTLKGNGACVYSLLLTVTPANLVELTKQLAVSIETFKPNLILIDNALPQKNDGLMLADKLFALNPENDFPCALISHHFLPEDVACIQEKVTKLRGALLRPVTPEQVLILCQGGTVWSEGVKIASNTLSPNRFSDFRDYYLKLKASGFADAFVVLESYKGEWRLEHGEGEFPLVAADIRRVLQESDLHLLADKRLPEIFIKRRNTPDSRLLGNTIKEAFWFSILSSDGVVQKLVGLCWKMEGHRQLAEALRDSIQEKYLNQAWQAWAQHNANFISSGLTVHSLIHEHQQYLHQIQAGLETLQLAIAQQRLEFLPRTCESMMQTWKNMQALAIVLLKGQASRTAPAHIPDLLETLDTLMQPYAKEAHVDFRIINKPRLSIGIATANLLIPLTNLVSNACKHHFRSSERRVSLVTQIQQDNGQYWLDFQVRDNGGGIPSYQLNRLFQAGISFAQEAEQQHGIGLWLARTIANRVDGDILLSSNFRGLGCCFTLRVPLVLG